MLRDWWITSTERLCIMLAYVAPRRVVYWCLVRAAEHASVEKLRPHWLSRGVMWGPTFGFKLSYVLDKWETK